MRIAILGAGGVGGYFGAVLARAGHDVVLFARGEHLHAINRNGLTIQTEGHSFTVPIPATDDPAALAGAELAIVAVKSYSLTQIAPVAAALADDGAVVLPLLNGVDAAGLLERRGVSPAQVVGGLAMVSAAKIAPGVIQRAEWHERIVLGELDGSLSPRVERIAETFRSAGIDSTATGDIVVELWRKFNQLCAMAAACGLARTNVAGIRDAPLGRALITRAVDEIATVGRARGIAIPADQEATTMQRIGSVPGTMKPSFLLDVERGGPTELDVLSGAVSAMGREAGVPTPVHDTATAALGAATSKATK